VTISKTLILNKDKYYETHLSIINGVLPVKLTPMEITVLAAFMSLEEYNDKFCTSARKIVKAKLNLSDGGLGNYLKSLREKKFIMDKDNMIVIFRPLIPTQDEQTYSFKLIKN
jgi:hypothetical protein